MKQRSFGNIDFEKQDGTISFHVRVIPRASKSEIVGAYDGALKVKLTSPPVNGAANDELKHLIAKEFGLSRSQVEIVSGHASKDKRIRIIGLDAARVNAALKRKT